MSDREYLAMTKFLPWLWFREGLGAEIALPSHQLTKTVYDIPFRSLKQPSLLPGVVNAATPMSRQIGSEIHEELRELLKERRFRSKLKQSELAEKIGWSQRTISQIETGDKRVTVVELIELSRALEFDPAAAIRRLAKIRDE
jgi:DNA-binding XRE family transcriptional regulator